MFGHRPFFVRFIRMADHKYTWSVVVAGQLIVQTCKHCLLLLSCLCCLREWWREDVNTRWSGEQQEACDIRGVQEVAARFQSRIQHYDMARLRDSQRGLNIIDRLMPSDRTFPCVMTELSMSHKWTFTRGDLCVGPPYTFDAEHSTVAKFTRLKKH